MITCAHQAAPHPQAAAPPAVTSDRPAAAKPSTVAGPTKGPATALANNPDILTCPEMAATTGSVVRCAARGTATASAATLGSQRTSRSDQLRAQAMMPALASTDRANPTDRLR